MNHDPIILNQTKKGEQVGRDLLIRKATGYVSYVRGENPFSFPNAIYPYSYDDAFSIKSLKMGKAAFEPDCILPCMKELAVHLSRTCKSLQN